jgi:hypothetical protein
MAKTEKDLDGILKDLAQISDLSEGLFNCKTSVVFDMDIKEIKRLQMYFKEKDMGHNSFKIDISGTEFIFISSESLTPDTNGS